MADSKLRIYIRTEDGLRRIPLAAIERKRSYPKMANAGDIRYLQVVFGPDDQIYDIRAGLARADKVGVLDFAPDTNLLRMRIEAVAASLSSGSFIGRRVKQLNAEEQVKHGPTAAEIKLLKADLFGGGPIPFLAAKAV